jgi:hypothetical protein
VKDVPSNRRHKPAPPPRKQVAEDDDEDPIARNFRAYEPETTDEIPEHVENDDAERAHETPVRASEHDHGR